MRTAPDKKAAVIAGCLALIAALIGLISASFGLFSSKNSPQSNSIFGNDSSITQGNNNTIGK